MSDAYPRDPRAWQSVQELIKCSAAFNISSDGIYLIRIRFPYESTYSQRQIPILMMATHSTFSGKHSAPPLGGTGYRPTYKIS